MTDVTRHRHRTLGALAAILVLAAGAITGAMLRTSTTFDEIVMIAGGVRGYETGDWALVPEHPPLVQYLYGLPALLAAPELPDETGVTDEQRRPMIFRYLYAQELFWGLDNDPVRLARLGRIPAVLAALALILLVFLWTRRLAGDGPALLAALLTASLPDVIAHGGVAYNDVPIALAYLATTWAIARAIHTPSIPRGALAGALIALSLGVKNSAVALGPVAIILLAWEIVLRRRDREWLRRIAPAALATFGGTYLMLVAIYRGDFALTEYRYALDFAFGHVTSMPVPSFLLGEVSVHGWWYFFPVAFLFKTSAGLHLLMLLALGYALHTVGRTRSLSQATSLRAPLVAFVVFVALLLASDLNIGFRYALPALPLLCMLTAIGVAGAWRSIGRPARAIVAFAALWPAIHLASHYPWFLSYMSEYGPGEDRAHEVLVDSSLDWGQGLLELRRVMQQQGIESVSFSYFGSALPAGYGIRHRPLTSFFALPAQPPLDETPAWVAISATNLSGTYFGDDPFAPFRSVRPDIVVARSIYLYRLE